MVDRTVDRSEDPTVGQMVDRTVDRSEDLMEGRLEDPTVGQKAETSEVSLLALMEERVAWTLLLGEALVPMQPVSRALRGKKGVSTQSTKDQLLEERKLVPVLLER